MGALEDIDPVKISRRQDDLLPTVQALVELWQDGPHDLINSPFSLPSVVPDPFDHMRDEPELSIHITNTEPELLEQSFERLPATKIVVSPGEGAVGFNGDRGCEKYALGRRFYISEKHYMSLASPQAEAGDLIAVLFGSKVPFILRRHGDAFRLISETHVQGIVDSEVMQEVDEGRLRAAMLSIVIGFSTLSSSQWRTEA